jgi:hypothetical protein
MESRAIYYVRYRLTTLRGNSFEQDAHVAAWGDAMAAVEAIRREMFSRVAEWDDLEKNEDIGKQLFTKFELIGVERGLLHVLLAERG